MVKRARHAKDEMVSLQTKLQQSLDRPSTKQGKLDQLQLQLQAEVASLHHRLQAAQVVITLNTGTIKVHSVLPLSFWTVSQSKLLQPHSIL